MADPKAPWSAKIAATIAVLDRFQQARADRTELGRVDEFDQAKAGGEAYD